MSFDLKSWLTGFTLGLAGKQMPGSEGKTPVAYLYNGVRLPNIDSVWTPELKATYPKALIATNDNHRYYLIVTANTAYYEDNSESAKDFIRTRGNYAMWDYNADSGENWGNQYVVDSWDGTSSLKLLVISPEQNQRGDCVIWSYYEVADQNGELVRSASDPIPVYEEA